MKTRTGFVSNSSSSSFIVAVDSVDKAEMTVKINLAELGKVLRTEQEVKNCFKDYWSEEDLEDDGWVKDKLNLCIAAIKQGKIIIFGDVSNEGDLPMEQFIYEEGISEDNPNIQVIQNTEG